MASVSRFDPRLVSFVWERFHRAATTVDKEVWAVADSTGPSLATRIKMSPSGINFELDKDDFSQIHRLRDNACIVHTHPAYECPNKEYGCKFSPVSGFDLGLSTQITFATNSFPCHAAVEENGVWMSRMKRDFVERQSSRLASEGLDGLLAELLWHGNTLAARLAVAADDRYANFVKDHYPEYIHDYEEELF